MTNSTDGVSIPSTPAGARSARACGASASSFPNDYWLKLDHEDAYPAEFVDCAHRGRLSRRPHPGRVRRRRAAAVGRAAPSWRLSTSPAAMPRACHAQMYTMGTGAAARQRRAEAQVPAGHRRRHAAPAGVRRHRADHRLRYHPAQDARRQDKATTATSSTARRCGRPACCSPT